VWCGSWAEENARREKNRELSTMRRITFALVGTMGLVAAACGGGGGSPSGGGSSSAAAGAAVRVTLSEFKFTPTPIEVPANTKVSFQLMNSGTIEHDLTAKGLGLHLYVAAAKKSQEDVGPFTPGEYEIYCGIAGHREAGMVGKIVVK